MSYDEDHGYGLGFTRTIKTDNSSAIAWSQAQGQIYQHATNNASQQSLTGGSAPIPIPPSPPPPPSSSSDPPSRVPSNQATINTIPLSPADAQIALANAQAIALKLQSSSLQNLLKKDRIRIQRALLKNFEYISKRDEEAYHAQLREIENLKTRGKVMKKDGEDAYEYRKKQLEPKVGTGDEKKRGICLAGIGTEKRRKQRKATGDGGSSGVDPGASIYVSGFVVEGKNDAEMDKEIRHLFGSYGRIKRVKVYKDASNNRLKGDALVVYRDAATGVDDVCSQLNGAELPCGSIITVQPACFDSKIKKSQLTETEKQGTQTGSGLTLEGKQQTEKSTSSSLASHVEEANKKINVNHVASSDQKDTSEVTDDLDDFFASLT